MEVLDGTTIFWLIAVGMLAGALAHVTIWKRGVKITTNLLFGIAGAVITGSISVALQMPPGLLFGFLGSLAILFILNVFHLQGETAH